MSKKTKSVPLNSPEALEYLSNMLGVPVTYGDTPQSQPESPSEKNGEVVNVYTTSSDQN